MVKQKESDEALKGWLAIAKFLSHPFPRLNAGQAKVCPSRVLVGTSPLRLLSWSAGSHT
jgi:hypothetical protein